TDAMLGEIFEAYGGLEPMLRDVTIVLTGDHSQSDVVEDKTEAAIDLEELLAEFAVAAAGTPMESQDDLVACPNLRTAQIYFHTPTQAAFHAVLHDLLADTRVDQIMWSADLLDPAQTGIHVATRARGQLRFWPAREADGNAPNQ